MANLISVELVGGRELIARLDRIPQRLHTELKRAMFNIVVDFRSLVMEKYLSGPTGAHTLSVRTGNLRRSVKWLVEDTSTRGVVGAVRYGADVPYARIHELGGTIHIPEITPVNAAALHFEWMGAERFFKRVAAHDAVIPERAPLRTAFREFAPQINLRLRDAVQKSLSAPS